MPEFVVKNRLLTALPQDVLSRLLPRLRSVPLTVRNTLMTPQSAIEAAYFVESYLAFSVPAIAVG